MQMTQWLADAARQRKPLPILSFPGTQLLGCTVRELVHSSELQARCMQAVAQRWDTLAAVSLMDLSVEAEAFGSTIRYSDSEVPTVTGALVQDIEDAQALAVPPVGKARTGFCVDAIAQAARLVTDRPLLAGAIGPFSLAGRLMDMTEIMVLCYTEPETVHLVLEKATQFLLEYIAALRDAGANGIVLAEPAAGLLSPALIAEFSSPYVRRLREALDSDDFLFLYHNCGNTIPLAESILSIGARAMHFGDAIALHEMLAIMPGDRIILGNVSPAKVLRVGTPETVRQATLEVLKACAEYPNYILSSGCDIPPATPVANIDAFFEAAKEFYGV